MVEPGLLDASRLLQEILFVESSAADHVLERFFRAQHSGQMERARINELVFYVLRHRRRLECMLRSLLPNVSGYGGIELATSALAILRDWPEERLRVMLGVGTHAPPVRGDAQPLRCQSLSAAERISLPDWLWQHLQEQWGTEEAECLGAFLNQPAHVDLRVNSLRASRDEVLCTLRALELRVSPTSYAPMALRLEQRHPLNGLTPFKKGLFEVQDEGSQLITHLLTPQPGWTVVDLCAGGGGKSLHLAALMQNRGAVIATDIDKRRLSRLGPRIKRTGARIVRTLALRHERDPKLKRLEGRADAVLVDAPCSGTGVLRRHPEIKWRLQARQVDAFHYRQCALLEAGARLTRPGGCLLYATCSLLQRENQDVAWAFLADNKNFRLRPVAEALAVAHIEGLPQTTPFLILLPHQTGTDGFFAALFQRVT